MHPLEYRNPNSRTVVCQSMHQDWLTFFEDYARLSLGGSAHELACKYADGFVMSEPGASYGANNDEKFLQWLESVHGQNHQIGMTAMRPLQTQESPIGSCYVLVAVTWGAQFAGVEHEIEFVISYVMTLAGERPRIVASLSHESQSERMRQEGIGNPEADEPAA